MSSLRRVALGVAALLVATSTACVPSGGGPGPGGGSGHVAARGPVAPLASDGRWLTDANGRVVTLHGVN